MSWEWSDPKEYPCPCGKGTHSEAHGTDDWGRSDERQTMNCHDAITSATSAEVVHRKSNFSAPVTNCTAASIAGAGATATVPNRSRQQKHRSKMERTCEIMTLPSELRPQRAARERRCA